MTTVKSPAKLNLFLHITGRRPDGYHALQTIFQLIDLCDEMTFTPRDDDQIILTCNLPELATQDNLILKAARALKQDRTLPGFTIHLNKIIPMGGGLGGGSSNAATALIVLNRLWELNLSEEALLAHAMTLGADVPVFVKGITAWGEGIGEELTPIELPEQAYLIVQPPVHVSTPKLFSSPHLTRNTKPITIRDYQQGSPTHNDFESLVRADYPAVQAAFDKLATLGNPRLTGSGACLFITCNTLQEAKNLVGQCAPPMVAFAAQGLRYSPLHTAFWGVAKW
jgi:4-diphosphocytidyl-2-C-methyl-D-erythritol kinase